MCPNLGFKVPTINQALVHTYSTARAYGNLYSRIRTASQFPHSCIFFSEYSWVFIMHLQILVRILRIDSRVKQVILDLSAATRIYVKKGVVHCTLSIHTYTLVLACVHCLIIPFTPQLSKESNYRESMLTYQNFLQRNRSKSWIILEICTAMWRLLIKHWTVTSQRLAQSVWHNISTCTLISTLGWWDLPE